MHVHAIKTITGTYKIIESNNEEYSHWILDKKTYGELVTYKNKYQKEVPDLKKQINELIEELNKSRKIAQANYDYVESHKAQIEEKENEYKELIQEATDNIAKTDKLKELTEKIIKISKERSNKDRNIDGKRTHCGYVMLSKEQLIKELKFNNEKINCLLWRTTIQTPFFAELKYKEIKNLVTDDSDYIEKIISQTGKIYEDKTDNIGEFSTTPNGNYVFESRFMMEEPFFKANFRSGFWEMVFINTREVTL